MIVIFMLVIVSTNADIAFVKHVLIKLYVGFDSLINGI